MEQQFNEQNSLQLIESMINKAKNNFSESGTLYLLWGIVVFICSIVQFVALYFYNYQEAYYIWFATWLVVIYQIVFLSRRAKKEKAKTYTADILKYVWICFAACMFLFIFILQYKKAYFCINPAILILYGIPTFLSGIILKFRPLVIGGLICWLLAIGCVFIADDFQLLFICAAVVSAWIIPGLLLRRKFKNQH
ncbi:MAG: hypothetical protein ABI741_07410 [Ferruginibacter sp.]